MPAALICVKNVKKKSFGGIFKRPSIAAALFLPLGFVTGLPGINVGGVPGEGVSCAFIAVCAVLALIAGAEFWLFRRMRLFQEFAARAAVNPRRDRNIRPATALKFHGNSLIP